jgi:mannose-6-phosphate isomerase-like protein (cupin superfamily)
MVNRVRKYRSFFILAIVCLFAVSAGVYYYQSKQAGETAFIDSKAGLPYVGNIVKETELNTDFRKVLFTGTRSQLVVMNIPPGEEVGEETHVYTEQTLFFLSGSGKAILDGKESPINAGDVVVVTPGTKHNFINTGTIPLKIYTVYAPPNHIDGRIHVTKADADKDVQDELYGEKRK